MNNYFRGKLSQKANNTLYWIAVVFSALVISMMPNLVQNGVTDWITYTYFLDARWMMPVLIVIISAILVGISSVVRNFSVPAALLMILSSAVGVAHTNKLVYRSSPILPSDIFLLKDALLATEEYPVVISKTFWLFLVLAVVFAVVAFPIKVPLAAKQKGMKRGLSVAAVVAVCSAVSIGLVMGVFFNTQLLTEHMRYREYPKEIPEEYKMNTFYCSFLKTWGESKVTPPEGYGKGFMTELGEEIALVGPKTSEGDEIDIIILQLESYYVPDKFGLEYDFDLTFGGFFEIMQRYGGGYVVPTLAGNCTADVEFEVLTGFATNDGQIGANPFSTYVYSGFPSIVGFLKEQGYTTAAIHSHTSKLYNRESVYANFGFDSSYFKDDFEDPALHGDHYIKEHEAIDKLIEVYESMPEDGGRFVHTVTMQNHLPIYYDTYEDGEMMEAYREDLTARETKIARAFITSSAEITAEVQRLVEYLEQSERDVILICYGDHQSIINSWHEGESFNVPALGTDSLGATPEEQYLALRKTPFFVYTNYESGLEGTDFGYLAPNSLLVNTLCEANVIRPAYFQYLNDVAQKHKSLSGQAAVLPDDSLTFDLSGEIAEELLVRRFIQYDVVYGKHFLTEYLY